MVDVDLLVRYLHVYMADFISTIDVSVAWRTLMSALLMLLSHTDY